MAGFFVGWQLWLQMTFVLVLLLIAFICAGLLRNFYVWRRNKKYITISQAQKEKVEVGELERQIDVVPFGIRALETGIQVEGVWISRPSTPVRTSPDHSTSGSVTGPTSGGHSSSPLIAPGSGQSPHIIMPKPISAAARHSFTSTNRISPSLFDTWSTIGQGSLELTKPASPVVELTDPSPSTLFPSRIIRNSAALEALEGVPLGLQRTRGSSDPRHGNRQSRSGSQESNHSDRSDVETPASNRNAPSPTDGFSITDTRMSMDARGSQNFPSASNHRLSHVAETGQLYPRVRHPKVYDPSSNRADVSPEPDTSTQSSPDRFVTARMPSGMQYFQGGRTPSPPEVTAPMSYVPGHAPSSIHQSLRTPSPTDHPLKDDVVAVPEPSFQGRDPQVSSLYRRVNANFEVRRTGTRGTLEFPTGVDLDTDERRHSKKLQKRRPEHDRRKSTGTALTNNGRRNSSSAENSRGPSRTSPNRSRAPSIEDSRQQKRNLITRRPVSSQPQFGPT